MNRILLVVIFAITASILTFLFYLFIPVFLLIAGALFGYDPIDLIQTNTILIGITSVVLGILFSRLLLR